MAGLHFTRRRIFPPQYHMVGPAVWGRVTQRPMLSGGIRDASEWMHCEALGFECPARTIGAERRAAKDSRSSNILEGTFEVAPASADPVS